METKLEVEKKRIKLNLNIDNIEDRINGALIGHFLSVHEEVVSPEPI